MDAEKRINTFTIEIENSSIRITPESETIPWWRQAFDKQTQGILCPEIVADMERIAKNLSEVREDGVMIGKYGAFMTSLPPKPRSSQGKRRKDFRRYLIDSLKEHEQNLQKFKDKKVLIYIAVYLRKERFETNDTDNFIKAIIDAVKVYIGDDKNVLSILTEKRCLDGYPVLDLDFLEQTLLVIVEPEARKDIFA